MADILDAIAHPNVVNPLAAYGAAADVANKVNSNTLFRAQLAAGRAYQQATDPTTGVVDPGRAAALIAADPNAAATAQASATSGQALTGAQQDQAMARSNYISAALAPVLKLDDSQLAGGVHQALQQAVADKVLTPAQAIAAGMNLPTDPGQLRARLQQVQIRGQPPELAQRSISGTPTIVNTGGTLVPGTQSTQTGAFTPAGGSMPNTLSPGEATAPTQIGTTADGRPIMGTRTQFVGAAGDAVPGAAPASPLGTGRIPPALRNPAAPASAAGAPAAGAAATGGGAAATPAPAAAAPAVPPQGVVTGLGPAATAAAGATGTASAAAFNDIASQGAAARQQSATLGNMLGDVNQFTSGPLSDRILKIGQLAQRFGLTGSTDGTTARESFNKLAAQLASQQGAGSDARLAVAEDANPHADLSPGGVDLMLRQLQGNADYLQARATVAANYPDKSDRNGFEAKVGQQLDPRAFQFSRMTVPQRQQYAGSLAPADRRAVRASYNAAVGMGLIGAGNGQ